MSRRYRFGWGDCQHCGRDVAATLDGRAVRHGFIRVRAGYVRTAFPNVRGGSTAYAYSGSGLPLKSKSWFKPYEVA
jgi:hypothetical protein